VKSKDFLWWKHGVIYQIYPRSFYDSNNDGIGDIPGIIEKLDYLENLGIDAIWLSPINNSPMFDFGYDISNYRDIDPIFGTLKDFKQLLKEAHKKNIKIIMDLVVNHTSHLHPWFIESKSSKNNPKSDWYIWHDGKKGKPPNNWLGTFGGKAWEWDETREQFYLHTFLKEQPDLNWRNQEVKEAVFGEIKFWLDLGIDGFRLDVVNWFFKDDKFRSNPFTIGPTPRPYDLQKHIYDRNRPETHELLKEVRKFLDKYKERMSVGEVYCPPPGDPKLSAEYLGNGKDELHLSFDFSIIFKKYGAKNFIDTFETYYKLLPEEAWPCTVLSNHDQPRSLSRYDNPKFSKEISKVLATILLTTKGTPFIYYGEEIGMKNGKIKKNQIMDPVGKKYWPIEKGRDKERTPMLWTSGHNAGFTRVTPWLPINEEHKTTNVDKEEKHPDSTLNFYKELIALRKKEDSLITGTFEKFYVDKSVATYFREYNKEKILVVINFFKKVKTIPFPKGEWKPICATHRHRDQIIEEDKLKLSRFEIIILKKIN